MPKQIIENLPSSNEPISELKRTYLRISTAILSYTGKYPLLITTFYLALVGNLAFWNAFDKLFTGSTWDTVSFSVSFLSFIILITAILFNFVRYKYIFKPVLIIILVSSSFASYFMNNYGVMIDTTMIYNIAETDYSEATELMGFGLFSYVLIMGVIPAIIIFKSNINYISPLKQIFRNSITMGLLIILFVGNILLFSSHYTSFFKNNHHVRYLVNPINYVYSIGKYLAQNITIEDKTPIAIGKDARQLKPATQTSRRSVIVLVVGETARAQNFSLNGYNRQTNPLLENNKEIFNYTNFNACGTSTHISLPCMFSMFGRDDFDEAMAKRYEKLPDVLQRAGIDVSWRDNNSGCKGVCKNIPTEYTKKTQSNELCNNSECFDDAMLVGLKYVIENKTKDAVIILHQQGSHGPAYYLRHPKSFQKFVPECTTNELNNCSSQEIVNAYDNTILYTDHFLDKVLSLLKQESKNIDTAMIYVSDHGESLGEHQVYLHSLPYMIAPDVQKKVPFIVWFSDSFRQKNQLDKSCLTKNVNKAYSHDNLFHTMLGLTNVSTSLYKAELDMFNSCKNV